MTSNDPSSDQADKNPYESSKVPPKSSINSAGSSLETYNVISDTLAGVNIRKSDNLFQLKVILVSGLLGVVAGSVAGALLTDTNQRVAGALGGGLALGFIGIILGLFGSGIYLMIYRAVRHLKGKHD